MTKLSKTYQQGGQIMDIRISKEGLSGDTYMINLGHDGCLQGHSSSQINAFVRRFDPLDLGQEAKQQAIAPVHGNLQRSRRLVNKTEMVAASRTEIDGVAELPERVVGCNAFCKTPPLPWQPLSWIHPG